jgi:hypothetical protein
MLDWGAADEREKYPDTVPNALVLSGTQQSRYPISTVRTTSDRRGVRINNDKATSQMMLPNETSHPTKSQRNARMQSRLEYPFRPFAAAQTANMTRSCAH